VNFNIYLDDETGQRLNRLAKQVGESRNALVREAVSDWLDRHGKPQWPDEVLAFKGMAGNWSLRRADRRNGTGTGAGGGHFECR